MKAKTTSFFILTLLCLVVSVLLAAPVRAASSKTTATIEDRNYASLEEAVAAVKKGETIVLQKNITYTSSLKISRPAKVSCEADHQRRYLSGNHRQ